MQRYLPSPTVGAWHLDPLAIRGYALCILAGIVVAVWMSQKRLEDRGGKPGQVLDIATWAVPFGIVGGRIYHLITSPQAYFGKGGHPMDAVKIWEGGLGIWGAVALGAVGAWIGCRRTGVDFLEFANVLAPGLAVAQALGRWGNWFNNEIYGPATDLPWALQIHEWDTAAGHAVRGADGQPIVLGFFHPTFLYEAVWCLLLAIVLLLLDRRFAFGPGQLFGVLLMGYTIERLLVEKMRTDPANLILGQRVNVWTSILVFLIGLAIYRRGGRRKRAADALVPHSENRVTAS